MSQFQLKFIQSYNKSLQYLKAPRTKLILKQIFVGLLLLGSLGFGLVYGYITSLTKDEPIRSNQVIISAIEDNNINGYVYFNDESEVGRLLSGEDRMLTALSDIPQQVIDATIAIEDKNLF